MDRADLYFPELAFSTEAEHDRHLARWFGRVLDRMGEPALYPPKAGASNYRFLLVPTFSSPYAVRLETLQGVSFLWVKKLDGEGGYDLGKLVVDTRTLIGPQEAAEFAREISENGLWDQPPKPHKHMLDATHYLIEMQDGPKYRVLERCTREGPVYDACMRLSKLANLDVK